MVFLSLDDVVGSVEVVVFNSVYAASREHLTPTRCSSSRAASTTRRARRS